MYDETIIENTAQFDDSDYPVEEAGSLPEEILTAKVSSAEKQHPVLVQNVKDLTTQQLAAKTKLAETTKLLDSWKQELSHWKTTLEVRITPSADDLVKIRAAEEQVVNYTTQYKTCEQLIQSIEKQLGTERQKLAATQALQSLNTEKVLSINLGDGLASQPFLMAQIAGSAITTFRYQVISTQDFELERRYERSQQLRAQLQNPSPVTEQHEEQLALLEEEIASFENQVTSLQEFETAYLLLFSHFYRQIEDPKAKQRVFVPKSYSEIRAQLQKRSQERLEQRLKEQKEARAQKAQFTDSLNVNFL